MSAGAAPRRFGELEDSHRRGALALARRSFEESLERLEEPSSAALAIVSSAVRSGVAEAQEWRASIRRLMLRLPLESEGGLRCLRALARCGEEVDTQRLAGALKKGGRGGRVALAALAERAVFGCTKSFELLGEALAGALSADAAFWLSHLCSEEALDLLSVHLLKPGSVGLHASTALLAAEDDPMALLSLVRRLCVAAEAVAATKALWGIDGKGEKLAQAHAALTRQARRGESGAGAGRRIAAVRLAAGGLCLDPSAPYRVLGGDDEVAVWGARALWRAGDAEKAHASAEALLRRAPMVAAMSFAALCVWADAGDESALRSVKRAVAERPQGLARAAMCEALAGCERPVLQRMLIEALEGRDQALALEAGRAVLRRLEPPSLVPELWL